ncbi:MAG: nuclear transport factor 2 family protein [Methyloceanibacter sp.]
MRAILGDIYDAWRKQNFDWLGSYLPDDSCHVIHIPVELHPLGGTRRGKKEALARLQLIVAQFHFDEIDTSDLLIERNRAAVEVPIRYRHRETGAPFESTKSNFWTLEDGWPVKLTEYHAIARVQAFVSAVAGAHPA